MIREPAAQPPPRRPRRDDAPGRRARLRYDLAAVSAELRRLSAAAASRTEAEAATPPHSPAA